MSPAKPLTTAEQPAPPVAFRHEPGQLPNLGQQGAVLAGREEQLAKRRLHQPPVPLHRRTAAEERVMRKRAKDHFPARVSTAVHATEPRGQAAWLRTLFDRPIPHCGAPRPHNRQRAHFPRQQGFAAQLRRIYLSKYRSPHTRHQQLCDHAPRSLRGPAPRSPVYFRRKQ